ncbi:MAG: protein kinase [Verrucomicrobiales bacterium]|nr:protein kinase [Verrucomicrobiales bacterium]
MADSCCPRCGALLAEGVLAGQCPRCLGALAFQWDDAATSVPGLRLGDYEFVRELGRGGIGVVYEAVQARLNRRVAIKMLLSGPWAPPELRHRFRAEAEAAARVRHPGIVSIHEIGELEGQLFIVMELVIGPSLADLVRTHPLPAKRAARIVRWVADAIAHAHACGVLHRDLKPSNVLLDETEMPRVTDFGLAKLVDAHDAITRTGEVAGSPNYMAPEQVVGGAADASSDLYSIGAILYQLLTARPPFMADTVPATLKQVVESEPVPPRQLNASVPRDLETICLKCLRKEPRRRYANVVELGEDLARFEAGEPVVARQTSHAERLVSWCRRKPALAAVSAGLGLSLIGGFAGVLLQWHRAEASRRVMAENLYAADVAAAAAALKDGNLGRARELLLRQSVPAHGGVPEFTWNLLWSRCQGDELAVLGSHAWIVTCVAVSPDGVWAASGSQSPSEGPAPTLKLWRLEVGNPPARLERTLALSNTVWSVAFADGGRTLVSGGVDGVRFWDVETGTARSEGEGIPGQEVAVAGEVLVASPNHPFFDASAAEPMLLYDFKTKERRTLGMRGRHPALSPDGRRLAFLDGQRNVQLHELPGERWLATVATNHLVFRLRFSPDGTRLLAAGQMTSAKLWDLTKPESPPVLFRSDRNVWDATLTSDGSTLVSATSRQQLEVWDARDIAFRRALAGHDNEVWSVAATPDTQHLVSGGKDRTVRLWSLHTRSTPPVAPQLRSLCPVFSIDGSRLLTYAVTGGKGWARVWQMAAFATSGPPEVSIAMAARHSPLGFTPDGSNLLFASEDGFGVDWRRPETGERLRKVEFSGTSSRGTLLHAALSGDARSLAALDAATGWGRWSTEDGRLLQRWSDPVVGDAVERRNREGPASRRVVRSWSSSRSGRWLAWAPFGTAWGVLVDFERGTSVRLSGHRDDIAALAFSWDEQWLATGSVDGSVRLWEVRDGRHKATLPGHFESVEAVAFSPDGQTLAAVNPGVEVTFWHLPTLRELARVPHPDAGHHLVFSPDGRRLALNLTEGGLSTGTDRMELWGRW